MTRLKELTNRRKYERFKIQTGTLVFNEKIFGELIDISRDGLAFSYRDHILEFPESYFTLDIMCVVDGFFLSDICCMTVSDFEYASPVSTVTKTRRRGVQLCNISGEQARMLAHFTNAHDKNASVPYYLR